MRKPVYVKAALTLDPAMDPVAKKKAKRSLQGPLGGKLTITGWKNTCPTTIVIQGELVEPEKKKKAPSKPKKAKAPRVGKKKGK